MADRELLVSVGIPTGRTNPTEWPDRLWSRIRKLDGRVARWLKFMKIAAKEMVGVLWSDC